MLEILWVLFLPSFPDGTTTYCRYMYESSNLDFLIFLLFVRSPSSLRDSALVVLLLLLLLEGLLFVFVSIENCRCSDSNRASNFDSLLLRTVSKVPSRLFKRASVCICHTLMLNKLSLPRIKAVIRYELRCVIWASMHLL